MPADLWKSLLRTQVEWKGRRQRGIPPQFGIQVVSPSTSFTTGRFNSDYLYVFPDCAAVLTAPDGGRTLVTTGGYVDLPGGIYTLQYVDQRKHMSSLPAVSARAADGPQVSLAINLSWQVKDPLAILSTDQPVNVLLSSANTVIKSFIQSHKHDEVAQGQDRMRLDESVIRRYVTQELGQNQACRGFAVIDVQVSNRQGNPELLEIQEARLLQEKKTSAAKDKLQQETELVDQNEQLLRRQAGANRLKVEQEVELERIRVELQQQVAVLQADIDRLRKIPEYQHEEAMEAIRARTRAIEGMLQTMANKGFILNGDEARVLETLTRSLPDNSAANSTPLAQLSSSLNRLMPPTKK